VQPRVALFLWKAVARDKSRKLGSTKDHTDRTDKDFETPFLIRGISEIRGCSVGRPPLRIVTLFNISFPSASAAVAVAVAVASETAVSAPPTQRGRAM